MRRQMRHRVGLCGEHPQQRLVHDVFQQDLDGHGATRHVLFIEEDVGEASGPQRPHVTETGQRGRSRGKPARHRAPAHPCAPRGREEPIDPRDAPPDSCDKPNSSP